MAFGAPGPVAGYARGYRPRALAQARQQGGFRYGELIGVLAKIGAGSGLYP